MSAPVIEAAARGDALVHWGAAPAFIARRGAGLAYLASPLTGRIRDRDAFWQDWEDIIEECAADLDALAAVGVSAISPVLMALEMIGVRRGGVANMLHGPRGVLAHDYWMRWSGVMLSRCDLVVVADRPGWQVSQGIAREVECALSRNVPVFFMGAADG